MRPYPIGCLTVLVLTLTNGGGVSARPFQVATARAPSVGVRSAGDYHLHLLSAAAVKQLATVGIVSAPRDATVLVAQLDTAGIERGVVLSTAYWFGGGVMPPPPGDEYENVRAENDWTIQEVGRYSTRLVAFCAVNPLKSYAVTEIERCASRPGVRGIKLHLSNSRVDLRNAAHVSQLQQVFVAANGRRLAIAVHLWNGREYGARDAEVFLRDILPTAPDIAVQVAHMAGGGPGYTDSAFAVFGDAIAAGDVRTQHLYFDVATVANDQSQEMLRSFAMRIRQVGVSRILFGTDVGEPQTAWETFASRTGLSPSEVAAIAGNVTPYLR